MPLPLGKAKQTSSVPAPAGLHLARCVAVVDLGTQTEDGKYGTKTARKIRISWELPDELHVFKQENGPQPFMLHKKYNFFTSEKASLRLDLESWRGRPFTQDELTTFDLENLLGVPCMLNVVHNDKGYANIDAITPLPKGMKNAGVTPQINKSLFYSIDQGKDATFAALPDFLKQMIEQCEEWKGTSKSHPSDNGLAADGSLADEDLDGSGIPF